MPARDAADRLASLQGLFDKANLLVVPPSPPTLGAQHIDLHSPHDLKAKLKVRSSGRLSNYTRRPTPEGYRDTHYLTDVLERIVSGRTKINQLNTLLPWNWKAERDGSEATLAA